MNIIYYKGTDKVLYEPNNPISSVTSATLKQAVNQVAQLEFTVFDNNQYYNDLQINDFIIAEYAYNQVFAGIIVSISRSLFGGKTVLALSAETLFERCLVPPYLTTYTVPADSYVNSLLTYVTSNYSSIFDFTGATTNLVGEAIAPLDYGFVDALSILKSICENNGITYKVMYVNGKMQMWFNAYAAPQTTDSIILGYNLLDYADQFSLNNIITSVHPLGAEDGTYPSGATKYITITPDAADVVNNTIDNMTLVNAYGRKCVAINFGAVTDRTYLRQLGQDWLSKNAFAQLSLTVSGEAIQNWDGFNIVLNSAIGDKIQVICQPFGVNTAVILQERTLDFLHPDKSIYNLSGTREFSYTQQIQRKMGGLTYD